MLKPDVFIAYSHEDRGFVSKLARDLFNLELRVWWDEWEMRVGDSLLNKIGHGIKSASYLIAVLSRNSVNSEWVNRELNAALSREIQERRAVVLPVLIEDCEIPTFLRDKFHADFRESYEQGFATLSHRLNPPDIGTHERQETPDRHFNDYAYDWGKLDDFHAFHLDIASHGPEASFSVIVRIRWAPNEALNQRLDQFEQAGFDWAPSLLAIDARVEMASTIGGKILIPGNREATLDLAGVDPRRGMMWKGHISARRLGPNEDWDLLFEFASILQFARDAHREGLRQAVGQEAFEGWVRFIAEHPL